MPSVPRSKRHLLLCSGEHAASLPYTLPCTSAASSLELGANDDNINALGTNVSNEGEGMSIDDDGNAGQQLLQVVVASTSTTTPMQYSTAINSPCSTSIADSINHTTSTSLPSKKQLAKKSATANNVNAADGSSVVLQSCNRDNISAGRSSLSSQQRKVKRSPKRLTVVPSSTKASLTCSDIPVQIFGFFKNDARNLVYDLGLPICIDSSSLSALSAANNGCNCSLLDKDTLKSYRLIQHDFNGSLLVKEEEHVREVYRKCGIVAHSGQELRLRVQNTTGSGTEEQQSNTGSLLHYCLLYQVTTSSDSTNDNSNNTFYCLYPSSQDLRQQQFATLQGNSEILLSLPIAEREGSMIDDDENTDSTSMRILLLCYTDEQQRSQQEQMAAAYESFTCIVNMAKQQDSLVQVKTHDQVPTVLQQWNNVIVFDYHVKIIAEEEQIEASAFFSK